MIACSIHLNKLILNIFGNQYTVRIGSVFELTHLKLQIELNNTEQ